MAKFGGLSKRFSMQGREEYPFGFQFYFQVPMLDSSRQFYCGMNSQLNVGGGYKFGEANPYIPLYVYTTGQLR